MNPAYVTEYADRLAAGVAVFIEAVASPPSSERAAKLKGAWIDLPVAGLVSPISLDEMSAYQDGRRTPC